MNDAEALLSATSTPDGREDPGSARPRRGVAAAGEGSGSAEVEDEALRRAREIADATDEYVRENPWQSVGIAAGVGLLLGLLLSAALAVDAARSADGSDPAGTTAVQRPGCSSR